MKTTAVFLSSITAALALSATASAHDACNAQVAQQTGKNAATPCAQAPDHQRAESLFYLRLGEGVVMGHDLHSGPEMGLGYRLELNRVGIDASVNLGATDMEKKGITNLHGSLAKLTTQLYLNPSAAQTPYLGAGLSWGARRMIIDCAKFSSNGLQGELIAGYEFLRSSSIRMFVQADATLPLYMTRGEGAQSSVAARSQQSQLPAAVASKEMYLPSVGLSFGIGWGK